MKFQIIILMYLLSSQIVLKAQSSLSETDVQNLMLLREKPLIITDRELYYPGEVVWFKTIIQYELPALRDSLSRVLYVELLNNRGHILKTFTSPIYNGGGTGNFKLPRTLESGIYAIRAYTSWMLNYGSPILQKPIAVLDYNVNITCDVKPVVQKDVALTLLVDKDTFGCRSPIRLQLKADHAISNKYSSISMSVVDVTACPLIHGEMDIFTQAAGMTDKVLINQLKYPIEKGISIQGVAKNEKGIGIKSYINIFQMNLGLQEATETDADGKFSIVGLDFYDSLQFATQSVDKKGRPQGNVMIQSQKIPPTQPFKNTFRLDTLKSGSTRNIWSVDSMNEAKVLDEVVIRGKEIKNDDEIRKKMGIVYGTPDFVISGEDLMGKSTGDNWLSALEGRIPGFSGGKVTRAKYSTFNGNTQPLIIVDGVTLDVPLSSIPVTNIERVENSLKMLLQSTGHGVATESSLYIQNHIQHSKMTNTNLHS